MATWPSNGQQTGTGSVQDMHDNHASDGDIITIPNGTYTWNGGPGNDTGGVTLVKAVTLKAVGPIVPAIKYTSIPTGPPSVVTNPPSVTITHGGGGASGSGLIALNSSPNGNVRLGGISFSRGSGGVLQNYLVSNGSSKQIVLYACAFDIGNFAGPQICGAQGQGNWAAQGGLVYNCHMYSNDNGASWGSGSGCFVIKPGSPAWYAPSTFGMLDANGDKNIYFEQCQFDNIYNQCLDCDDNGRMVIRYCVVNNTQFLTHGITSSWGGRQVEIYACALNNVAMASPSSGGHRNINLNRYFWSREGTHRIWGNSVDFITGDYNGSRPSFLFSCEPLERPGSGNGNQCETVGEYPGTRWTGTGSAFNGSEGPGGANQRNSGQIISPSTRDPVYIWGNVAGPNSGDGSQNWSAADSNAGCTAGPSSNAFKINQDVFLNAPPSTAIALSPGTGFISEPAGGYNPYTYPHPLNETASGAGSNALQGTCRAKANISGKLTLPPVLKGTAQVRAKNFGTLTGGTSVGNPRFIQGNSVVPSPNPSVIHLPFLQDQLPGDLNIIIIDCGNASVIQSVVDSAGNDYGTPVFGPHLNGAGAWNITIYVAKNIVASPAGTNTVTVTINPANWIELVIAEYGFVPPVGPLEAITSVNDGTGTSASASVTTTGINETILAYIALIQPPNAPALPAGFTQDVLTSSDSVTLAEIKANSPETITPTWALGATANTWTVVNIALKPGTLAGTNNLAGVCRARAANSGTLASGIAVAPFASGKSANGRYLIDQFGAPFFMIGDSAWSLISNLTIAQANAYFATRQSQGFNTILMAMLPTDQTGGNANGSINVADYPVTLPFLSGSGPATFTIGGTGAANPAYFLRAKAMVDLAGTYGMTVILFAMDTGAWLQYMLAAGATATQAYGNYVGNYFATCQNIIWAHGNDFNQTSNGSGAPGQASGWGTPATDAIVIAVANGIVASGATQFQTIKLGNTTTGRLYPFGESSSTDDANWWTLLGLNWGYTPFPTYELAKVNWQNNVIPRIPYVMGEFTYEGYNSGAGVDVPTPSGSLINLRKANWCSAVYGASGIFYGNRLASGFTSGYSLTTPGAIQSGYMALFYKAIAWQKMVPDFGHTFVTAGFGTEFTNLASPNTTNAGNSTDTGTSSYVFIDNYVPASLATDGTLAVVYLQANQTITVALSKMAGPVTALWYDATNNRFVDVGGNPYQGGVGAPAQNFNPGTTNGAGDGDWVLLLTTAPLVTGLAGTCQVKAASSGTIYVSGIVQSPFIESANASTTTLSLTIPKSQGAGDANVLFITGFFISGAPDIATVVDTANGTYTKLAGPLKTTNNDVYGWIYEFGNIKASPANTNVVNVTFTIPVAFPTLYLVEVAGTKNTLPYNDTVSTGFGIATQASASVTTAFARDAIVTFFANNGNGWGAAAGAGFTHLVLGPGTGNIIDFDITSSIGTFADSPPPVQTGSWISLAVALELVNPVHLKSTSLVHAANSGQLRLPKSLAGIDTIKAANNGILQARKLLIGTETTKGVNVGSLIVARKLQGVDFFHMASVGTITNKGSALAGIDTVHTNSHGTLTRGSGASGGTLIGSDTIRMASTGTLRATKRLAGVDFIHTQILVTLTRGSGTSGGTLAGTDTVHANNTGSLSATSIFVQLAGTDTVRASITATMTVRKPLAGKCTASIVASGNMPTSASGVTFICTDLLLNLLLRGISGSFPSTFYIGLLTQRPTDAGTNIVEITSAQIDGYQRQLIPVSPFSWSSLVNGQCNNVPLISYQTPATGTIAVSQWGLFGSLSGSDLYMWGDLTPPGVIQAGAPYMFPSGSLTVKGV